MAMLKRRRLRSDAERALTDVVEVIIDAERALTEAAGVAMFETGERCLVAVLSLADGGGAS